MQRQRGTCEPCANDGDICLDVLRQRGIGRLYAFGTRPSAADRNEAQIEQIMCALGRTVLRDDGGRAAATGQGAGRERAAAGGKELAAADRSCHDVSYRLGRTIRAIASYRRGLLACGRCARACARGFTTPSDVDRPYDFVNAIIFAVLELPAICGARVPIPVERGANGVVHPLQADEAIFQIPGAFGTVRPGEADFRRVAVMHGDHVRVESSTR